MEANEMMMMFLNKLERHIEQLVQSNISVAEKINHFMGVSSTDRENLRARQNEHNDWLIKHDEAIDELKKRELLESKKKGILPRTSVIYNRNSGNN